MVNKNCKHFRHEPYMTPNNYDIYLDIFKIPANIKKENAVNLQNRLQRFMPLTKKIHVNLNAGSEQLSESNRVTISTKLKINGKVVDFI